MKSKPVLNRKVQLAFGSAILTLLIVGAVSYRGTVASSESERWVRHSHEALEELKDLLVAVKAIESSSRGFVLTGNQAFLPSYRDSVVSARQREESVRNLLRDNPSQQSQLPAVEMLVDQKINFGEMLINLRLIQGMAAAADAIRVQSDQPNNDEFERVVRGMQSTESKLLVLRNADSNRRLNQTKGVLIFGPALGLLIAIGAGWSALRDLSDRKKSKSEVLSLTEHLSLATAIAKVGVWGWDLTSNSLTWDATMFEIYGIPPMDTMSYDRWARTVHPLDLPSTENSLRKSIADNVSAFLEFRIIRSDGVQRIMSAVGRVVTDERTSISRMIGVNMDITEAKNAEEALRSSEARMTHAAQHDFLTGLPNRMLLNDRLSQAIALAARHHKKISVLFLDLDGFKHVNDSLGHPMGDRLLQSIAGRLVDCVRASDTVSRQGGDEFVVLLSEVEQADSTTLAVKRILKAIAEAHSIDRHDLHITCSIGVSVYPDDGLDAETLMRNADTAMYQAKENGPQSWKFFKPAMNLRAVARQSIEESLRRAVERNELALHYQPRIDLLTGKISGAEALLRWTHPVRGPVSPAEFIPVAEDCGLILPIGQWVLREACKQARIWIDAGQSLTTIAVNISAIQFRHENFLDDVFTILKDTGLDPRFLELELTESVLMKHPESADFTLRALRARGIQVAVDDFGTGYSSLSYLRRFPIDALKIDQSFVRQITTVPDETTLVAAIVSIGRSLKLRVVAEGVETEKQLAFLRKHQCDEAQGYFFSRPVPPDQLLTLLENGIPEARSLQDSLQLKAMTKTAGV